MATVGLDRVCGEVLEEREHLVVGRVRIWTAFRFEKKCIGNNLGVTSCVRLLHARDERSRIPASSQRMEAFTLTRVRTRRSALGPLPAARCD